MAEIAVVGAGIAGLATAVALQRCGHRVAVVEERTDTRSGGGISIWPNALAALGEPLVVLQRAALRDILTAALEPQTVTTGVALRELKVGAAGVHLRLSDSTTSDVDAVVGAKAPDRWWHVTSTAR